MVKGRYEGERPWLVCLMAASKESALRAGAAHCVPLAAFATR